MNASDVSRRILWVAEYTVYTRGFAARLAEGRRWLKFETYKLPRGDHDLGIAPKIPWQKYQYCKQTLCIICVIISDDLYKQSVII